MSVTAQLRTQFPDFWFNANKETTLIDSLLTIYSFPYASAYAHLTQIQNSFSIRNIDYYKYDFYYALSCKENVYVPTDVIPGYSYFFSIDSGIFNFINLCYDALFQNKVIDYLILLDTKTGQYFLALKTAPPVLFAEQVFNSNASYPFQSFFDMKPLSVSQIGWSRLAQNTLVVPQNYADLERVKAQYSNMMYTAISSGVPDALDSLFGVAFGATYAKDDGVIIGSDNTSVYVNHSGTIVQYAVSKLREKFKVNGTLVRIYESLEESPVRLVTWKSNPARFVQLLIGNNSQILNSLIQLQPGEAESCLAMDDSSLTYEEAKFDMGGHLSDFPQMTSEALALRGYSNEEIAEFFGTSEIKISSNNIYIPLPYFSDKEYKSFQTWFDLRYGKYPYLAMKNIIFYETELTSPWIETVLEEFKQLHQKFVPSPMNGMIRASVNNGYGQDFGRSYGGVNS